MAALSSLVFTSELLQSLRHLTSADQVRIFRALEVLDQNERHPSLNVHQLKGKGAGVWTAYASKSLRITFRRLEAGRKELLECSHHYGD